MTLAVDSTGVKVSSAPLAGTPLYAAGVSNGDLLLSLDGRTIGSEADWNAMLAARTPGDSAALRFRQRGREVHAVVRLTADPRVELSPTDQPTEAQRTFRESWLRSLARR